MGTPGITVNGPCTYNGSGNYWCEGVTSDDVTLPGDTARVYVSTLVAGEAAEPLTGEDKAYLRDVKNLTPEQIAKLEKGKPAVTGIVSMEVQPLVPNQPTGLTEQRKAELDRLACPTCESPARPSPRVTVQPRYTENFCNVAQKSTTGFPCYGKKVNLRFAPKVMERADAEYVQEMHTAQATLTAVLNNPGRYQVTLEYPISLGASIPRKATLFGANDALVLSVDMEHGNITFPNQRLIAIDPQNQTRFTEALAKLDALHKAGQLKAMGRE